MTRSEMLSMFFVHDGGETSKWRLKGHAEDVFWQWMASWSVFVDNPRNLGYEVAGFDLPTLHINEIIVDGDTPTEEKLSLTERREARKASLMLRCEKAADYVNNSDEQWLVWCDLNDESHTLHNLIDESVEVQGSDKDTHKTSSMLNFSKGEIKCLVTKPKIAGFGMNWQNCHNMIFTGLSGTPQMLEIRTDQRGKCLHHHFRKRGMRKAEYREKASGFREDAIRNDRTHKRNHKERT